MDPRTEILLLAAAMAVLALFAYLGTTVMPPRSFPDPAYRPAVAEVLDAQYGYAPYGALEFTGTVRSDTAQPVTAEIAAEVYDSPGRIQLARGFTDVDLVPYGTSPFTVVVHQRYSLPPQWVYRVYVEGIA